MGMKFHIKTASDVLAKGLDPRHPHSDLGHDGMLKVPSSQEAPVAPAVVSVLAPVVVEPPAPPPPPAATPSEPVKAVEVVFAEPPVAPAPLEPVVVEEPVQVVSAPVVEKTEEKAPESSEDKKSTKATKAKTPKTPAPQGQ
jgi:hypothetical protein